MDCFTLNLISGNQPRTRSRVLEHTPRARNTGVRRSGLLMVGKAPSHFPPRVCQRSKESPSPIDSDATYNTSHGSLPNHLCPHGSSLASIGRQRCGRSQADGLGGTSPAGRTFLSPAIPLPPFCAIQPSPGPKPARSRAPPHSGGPAPVGVPHAQDPCG